MKKKIILLVSVIVLIIGTAIEINLLSKPKFDESIYDFEYDESEHDNNFNHSLSESELLIISEVESPNKLYKYYTYQFDNGGFGLSRVFWSVIEINKSNLYKGIIPDGYKIIGWTKDSKIKLKKWTPYYDIKKVNENNYNLINGVNVVFVE